MRWVYVAPDGERDGCGDHGDRRRLAGYGVELAVPPEQVVFVPRRPDGGHPQGHQFGNGVPHGGVHMQRRPGAVWGSVPEANGD
jgi:hypothetical protein